MALSCPIPPNTASAPLKTTQAMSHKQPVDLPIELDHSQSAFIEEVNDKDLSVPVEVCTRQTVSVVLDI